MSTTYVCGNERRIQELGKSDLNGIDYLEVLDRDAPAGSPRQQTLLVWCFKKVPADLNAKNVRIEGGVRVKSIEVEWATPANADALQALVDAGTITAAEQKYFRRLSGADTESLLLLVRTSATGDFSTYTLRLVGEDDTDDPYPGFDQRLAEVAFSFKVECPSGFDCQSETICPVEVATEPRIDYLAKDYASFRQAMLDRLSVIMPDWEERHTADLGVALVEVIAYVADHLSYHQDAVGTETYLTTARRRPSLRQHARLLNYPMHDGCNARAWVRFDVNSAADGQQLRVVDAAGNRTRLLTKVPSQGSVVSGDVFEAIRQQYAPEVFEPMYDITLRVAHNEMSFYTWGDEACCLPQGSTRATLRGPLDLSPDGGDVLILEEKRGAASGVEADADPSHRHAVRLTRADPSEDTLFGQQIVEIEWMDDDALPFPLCVSAVIDGSVVEISVARGNVVLADHGRTIGEVTDANTLEELDEPTGERGYYPELDESDVTYRVSFEAEAWGAFASDSSESLSATEAVAQDPRDALPVVTVVDDNGESWTPQRDLIGSDRFDSHFVVEPQNEGDARLRFGDNVYGKQPTAGKSLRASYRVGNGTAGNVGAGAIFHVVAEINGIEALSNPLPASGGVDPENLEEVRQYAPQAFRTQERAVTEADYADVAERHSSVSRAAATRRWTGSWHTMFVTVDRTGGADVDTAFEAELTAWVDQYKLAGQDVEIEPPQLVPLDIAFTVCVKDGYSRSDVEATLFETFSNRDLSDGRRGFFHPDNFTFGQPVYLSRIVAAAMGITGVRWVNVSSNAEQPTRFQRWGEAPNDELENGRIDMGRLEIAQLDNDPNEPENGMIEFVMDGGS